MAVQKKKKTRSKKNKIKKSKKIKFLPIIFDSAANEYHIKHNISTKGFYKGKKII